MIPYLGDFVEDDIVYLMFNTFSSDDPSASITITNLANTDVHIHKDDNTTQRNNAAGITVSVNFDTITGSHMIKIDTNDNTVAGFWVTGHDYFVRIEGTTIDGATINAVVGHFSIQNRYTRGTDSAALASGVNVTQLGGVAQSATDLKDFADAGYDPATNKITGTADMRGTDSANTTTPPTVTAIREEMDTNSTKMAPSQVLADYKATGFSTHDAAAVKTAIEAAGSSLAQILADTNALELDWKDTGRLDNLLDACNTTTPPTVTAIREEMDTNSTKMAPSQTLNDYKANVTSLALEATLTAIKGGAFAGATDSLEAIRDRGDAAWTTGAGGSAPTVGEIRAEMEGNGYFLDLIKADTDELQINQSAWATATGFSTHSAADVKTAIEAAGSSIASILADTGTDGVVVAAGSKTGYTLTAAGVAAILDEIIEGTLTHRQIMRILLAALAGKSSGGGTVTLVFRDAADSKARITATVDTNGNRTAMTLDGA